MKILITGSEGFIGKNLKLWCNEKQNITVLEYTRQSTHQDLLNSITQADFIFHLAGVNRPQNPEDFSSGNVDLTKILVDTITYCEKKTPILYASSIQAGQSNLYGQSKYQAEQILLEYQHKTGANIFLYRLPNIFGKWCRPNYNSAVATFCYNTAHYLPIQINDPNVILHLVYIDDLLTSFDNALIGMKQAYDDYVSIDDITYSISVGQLAIQIQAFRECRDSLISERVGSGLIRALYSTYVSYLPIEQFSYKVPRYTDPRGTFVEILKTKDSGQFSFFTAHPGITRGGHYHHSKTEKFLVISGQARFKFRHVLTGENFELITHSQEPRIVDTIPGWAHDITNIGQNEMIVILWANENFNREHPDTINYHI